ncbi:MAG: hypothetical protein ABIY62_04755 [Ginsengibacter sp.]
MNDDLLNILSNDDEDIDNQKLLDYLNDNLSETEKRDFEKEMVNSDMLNDVVEGLGKFKNKKHVNALVEQLNSNLKTQLQKKKSKKEKRAIKNLNGVYFAVVMILIIILLAFIIIKKHIENEKKPTGKLVNKEHVIFYKL